MKRTKQIAEKINREKLASFQPIKSETQNSDEYSDEYSAELAEYSFCWSLQPIFLNSTRFLCEPEYLDEDSSK